MKVLLLIVSTLANVDFSGLPSFCTLRTQKEKALLLMRKAKSPPMKETRGNTQAGASRTPSGMDMWCEDSFRDYLLEITVLLIQKAQTTLPREARETAEQEEDRGTEAVGTPLVPEGWLCSQYPELQAAYHSSKLQAADIAALWWSLFPPTSSQPTMPDQADSPPPVRSAANLVSMQEGVSEVLREIIQHYRFMLDKKIVLDRFSQRELTFITGLLRGYSVAPSPLPRKDYQLYELRDHYYERLKSPRADLSVGSPRVDPAVAPPLEVTPVAVKAKVQRGEEELKEPSSVKKSRKTNRAGSPIECAAPSAPPAALKDKLIEQQQQQASPSPVQRREEVSGSVVVEARGSEPATLLDAHSPCAARDRAANVASLTPFLLRPFADRCLEIFDASLPPTKVPRPAVNKTDTRSVR